jgi:hypothetical protein
MRSYQLVLYLDVTVSKVSAGAWLPDKSLVKVKPLKLQRPGCVDVAYGAHAQIHICHLDLHDMSVHPHQNCL